MANLNDFAEQCLDLARSILECNIDAINEDGTITPIDGEVMQPEEPGHAAFALGEFHRATQETQFAGKDLVDLAARALTAQVFTEEESENGLACCGLGLLSFGPEKTRNLVWERLVDVTQETLDQRLLARSDYENHLQAFNIAKAVTRFSMGLSKKDETSKLIDKFLERLQQNSTGGVFDDAPSGLTGNFDIYGVLAFVFVRQALQLHSNVHLRDRKLPSLRTFAERYLKMLPDMVRSDGLGWVYGKGTGVYGQIYCISLILQAMRDQWISEQQMPTYLDVLRRLFHFFFMTYIDQENGSVVIRDHERNTSDKHTTRMVNFDTARYLCQWARLAKSIEYNADAMPAVPRTGGRFVMFDKTHKKEQGLFIYSDPKSRMHFQLPLMSSGNGVSSDSLAFPHAPGIFDWPTNKYLPILLPELTFGDQVFVPAFYGKKCVTGLGLRNSFYFRYEQPDLVTIDERIVPGIGSCKVNWSFSGNKLTSEFVFTVKNPVQLSSIRYVIAHGASHSQYRLGSSLCLGAENLRATVVKDDFQAAWADPEDVSNNSEYRTYFGKVHYLQVLQRTHPLMMRPGQQYRLEISFEPDIATVEG